MRNNGSRDIYGYALSEEQPIKKAETRQDFNCHDLCRFHSSLGCEALHLYLMILSSPTVQLKSH